MSTNLNIRTNPKIKLEAEKLFEQLGLNMTTAVNMFLIQSIRANGIPFEIVLDKPNDITLNAIKEGEELLNSKTAKKYKTISDLKQALDE